MTSFLHATDGAVLRPTDERYAPSKPEVENRPSPLEWIRDRRAERESRRAELAHQRAAQRLEALGHNWRVLDLQATAGSDRMSFLAVGPGGIFAVTVKDHGRSRVSFSGDVVQIDGRRPKHVQEARRNAKLAATALSRIAGVSVPVMPVLAFAGSGTISVYGMPKGVIISSYQELGRVLNSRGQRLAPGTVEKVYALAADPATWVNPPYVPLAERYRWYPDGATSTDKRPADKNPAAG
jgi:hypothetical protein